MDTIIFSGRSNLPLSSKICSILEKKEESKFEGLVEVKTFAGGDIYCKYKDNIRGKDVIIIQSTSDPNKDWMELFLLVQTARLASARQITVVIPYFSYARQDRKAEPRSPISARLMLDLLKTSGASRIITVDLHNLSIQGFTDLPLDSLLPCNLWINYIKAHYIKNKKDSKKYVVASPDFGGAKKTQKYAEILGTDFAIVHKKRLSDTKTEQKTVIGDVKGKSVFLIDDMTESLGTLSGASKILKKNGAKDVFAFVTHLPLTFDGRCNLESDKSIKKVLTTDSVDLMVDDDQYIDEFIGGDKIEVLSIAPMLAEAISCTVNNKSISKLFQIKGF